MEDRPVSASRLISLLTVALLAVASGAAPAAASASACGPVRSLDASYDREIGEGRLDQTRLSYAVVHFMNIERCRRGLSPLSPDKVLQSTAAGHSRAMASRKFFGHKSPVAGKRTLRERLKSASVKFRTAAENIAQRNLYRTSGRSILIPASSDCNLRYADTREPVPRHSYRSLAKTTVAAWMASAGHKRNILNRKFKRVGTGFGVDAGGAACGTVYLTQNFTD